MDLCKKCKNPVGQCFALPHEDGNIFVFLCKDCAADLEKIIDDWYGRNGRKDGKSERKELV